MFQLIDKDFERKVQGFVAGISNHDIKRLCAKFANYYILHAHGEVIQRHLSKFVNGIRVSSRNAAFDIYSEFIYLGRRL